MRRFLNSWDWPDRWWQQNSSYCLPRMNETQWAEKGPSNTPESPEPTGPAHEQSKLTKSEFLSRPRHSNGKTLTSLTSTPAVRSCEKLSYSEWSMTPQPISHIYWVISFDINLWVKKDRLPSVCRPGERDRKHIYQLCPREDSPLMRILWRYALIIWKLQKMMKKNKEIINNIIYIKYTSRLFVQVEGLGSGRELSRQEAGREVKSLSFLSVL